MRWFAAHMIVYFKRKRGPQKRFLVWENIVLIRAKSFEEAYEKAEQRGRQEEALDDGTTRIGGQRCHVVFAGVRHITLCQPDDARPTDGTEVSYNEWAVRSEAAIKKLVAGESVALELLEPFPDDETLVASEPTNLPRKTGS